MKYSIGVCTSLDRAELAARAQAAHIEPPFWATAKLEPQAFRDGAETLRRSGLTVDAMNSLLPGDAVLYGTDADVAPTLELVRRGMERAAAVGCPIVVFGSGRARNIPDGMDWGEAKKQLAYMATRFCEIARPYGIRIAIEPLRAVETNAIPTIAAAAEIIALCPDCPDLGINPDIYHMLEAGEPFGELSRFGDKVHHVHICAPDRHYPRDERPAEDMTLYRDFFRALRAADYKGTLNIEGIVGDMSVELPRALAILDRAQDLV